MFKKLMKRLANNPGLKLLSLLIAVVLWLIVVDIDDPDISRTFVIQVSAENEDMLEKNGKVYSVVGQSNFATIYVTGKRSIVDNLSATDFIATADFEQIMDLWAEGNEKLIPIDVSAKGYDEKDITITKKTNNMKIKIENSATEQFYISSNIIGTPMEGYAVGEITTSPNLISISGPESVVSRISKVAVSVNVEGMSKNLSTSVTPVLYDANGGIVESGQLKLSQSGVTVNIQMLGTKTVPVRCDTTGTPADGYVFMGLEYTPGEITIKGESSLLNNIVAISIPGGAVNLDGATEDVENSIDVTPYLEDMGVELVNPEANKVVVKALVERLETRMLELPLESVEILNLPEGYGVSYKVTKVLIPVRGKREDVSALTSDQIIASINLADMGPGEHKVELDIALDDKFQVTRNISVIVIIKQIVEEPEDIPEDNSSTGTSSGTDSGNNDAEEGSQNTGS